MNNSDKHIAEFVLRHRYSNTSCPSPSPNRPRDRPSLPNHCHEGCGVIGPSEPVSCPAAPVAPAPLFPVAFHHFGLIDWGHDNATGPYTAANQAIMFRRQSGPLADRVDELGSVVTMPHEATLIYSESLLRQAVFGFWRRSVGVGFLVALLVALLSLGVLIAQGMASWIVAVVSAVLMLGVGFAIAVYIIHYRNSLRKFRQMAKPQATFLADESTFTITSDIATTTLQWSAVKELWQFSSVWLFLYSKGQFTTLPLACLSPETQAHIVQCVRTAGGKVDG